MRFDYFIAIALIYFEALQFYKSHTQTRRTPSEEKILLRRGGSAYYHYIDKNGLKRLWRVKGPILNYRSGEDIEPKSGSFQVSKPKPWRNDNPVAVRANKANEVPADPNETDLEMKDKPRMAGRIMSSKQKKKKPKD